MQHADVGVATHGDERVYAQLAQREVEVGSKEAVVAALGDDDIRVLDLEGGQRLCGLGTGDAMLAPKLDLFVICRDMRIA